MATAASKRPSKVSKQRKLPLPAKGHAPARVVDSATAQIEGLSVGDSYTKGARIPMDDFAQESAKEFIDKVTRVLSMQVHRVKDANPQREYTIERVQGIANTTPNILCAVLVTRVK